jgi:hypothetical protein
MHPLGIEIFANTTKLISKGLLKIRSNYDLLKVHNFHLGKASLKKNHS